MRLRSRPMGAPFGLAIAGLIAMAAAGAILAGVHDRASPIVQDRASPIEKPREFAMASMHASTVAAAWSGVAPCLSQSDPHPEQTLHTELVRLGQISGLDSAKVAGFALVRQPEEGLAALRAILVRNPRTASPAAQAACNDLECAVIDAFGPQMGPRLLLLAIRFQKIPVLDATLGMAWRPSDLDDILQALDDLPPSLFPLRDEEYRSLELKDPGDLRSSAFGAVLAQAGQGAPALMLTSNWRKVSASERRATIVHEFAHDFSRARGEFLDWRREWRQAAQADAAARRDTNHVAELVSPYAEANEEEDFAESVTAYRYLAPALLQRGPHRYALLRAWLFDDLEYGMASTCAPEKARSRRAHQIALKALKVSPPDASARVDARMFCESTGEVEQCMAREFFSRSYRAAWISLPTDNPAASLAALNAQLDETRYLDLSVSEMEPELRYGLAQVPPEALLVLGK